MAIKIKVLWLFLPVIIMASGGYDHGTAAGKGNWDVSLTWNPFNYFEQGQSYIVLGYGLTQRMDIHGYYSYTHRGNDNYYGGFSYQFFHSKILDVSTAVGLRKYINESTTHLFTPQFLYTIHFTENIGLGGSFVNIMGDENWDEEIRADRIEDIGVAVDVFLMYNILEKNKYKVDFTVGGFRPVLWKPEGGDWYPTYSLDIKLKD